MPACADFLLEVGVEELPPTALASMEASLAEEFRSGLEEAELEFDELRAYASPRRMAILAGRLARRQPSRKVERRGPSLTAARDSAGNWTRAATGFAESCGCRPEELETLRTDKGEWLAYRGRQAGRPAAAILPGIVAKALKRLPIGRAMRWGSGDEEFVRPVHWVVMLHGKRVVPATILGRRSGRRSSGHRFMGKQRLSFEAAGDYASLLREQGRVIAGLEERREAIVQQVNEQAARLGGAPVTRPGLVDEVAGLVEWPVALTGGFDERFLKLPEPVIVASLQEHLRFFPVREKSGSLAPGFVLVSNLESRAPAAVSAGAERVVRARLKDAAFFYERDCSEPLAGRVDGLAGVRYQDRLGTLGDRSDRLAVLAAGLAEAVGADPSRVARAAALCKADLVTGMVGEFPNLQGVMGGYYARHDGEDEEVCTALGEHYAPRQAGDRIPTSPAGRALALADRLDMLAGLFAVGRRPKGASDPFGLRRAALAALRICIEGGVDINLPDRLKEALALQPAETPEPGEVRREIYDFMLERLRSWYLDDLHPEAGSIRISPELFAAVRARSPASPLDFHKRLTALHGFLEKPAANDLAAANKRIANILRSAGEPVAASVDADLLREPEERTLRASYLLLLPRFRQRMDAVDYAAALELLASLQAPLADLFDRVMVMSDDDSLRRNRLALLAEIRATLLEVADLSLLPGRG